MGMTRSDLNRQRYSSLRAIGYTHDEAMDIFPDHVKERMERDLEKSFIESHYGMKPFWFFFTLFHVVGAVVALALWLT